MGTMVVDGIPRQPLPYGLFSVLVPRDGADPHWEHDGVIWESLSCEPVSGIGPTCETDVIGLPKGFASNGDNGEADAFHVYGSYSCGHGGGHTPDYAQQRAAEHLQAREEAFVERAIWTGELDNLGFAEGAEQAVAGAVSIRRAIAALVQWLAVNYGSQGVLHMTREAAEYATSEDILIVVGNQLRTRTGMLVVAGAGYPGTGPAGQEPASGQTYIYATPALLGYRSEIFPGTVGAGAGFDKSTNDLYAVAERGYAVGWDPCGTAYALATLEEAI